MTNTGPATIRTSPPFAADEAVMLGAWLDFHRATLALKCEGLAPEQLRERACPPSSMSLLGLVRHLTEVERHWFRQVLDGQELDASGRYWSEEFPDGDFDLVDGADPVVDTVAWQEEVAFARSAAEGVSLDAVGKGRWRGNEVTLRWILVHMIEEYARHNGHADLLRERIDGSTGE
ncbi:DinB family protein [Kitasatospora sp. NA04385]|uniref:DinB family protein n=1 Tax=Kitasatospora sp. NA04385 TaxID=2742135 RepID=UPI0015910C9B|nr:DinB family protein [Kitasatospora sp. NA04385]QKW23495.1 DinB family protein [Kitasatospora sp. NA04385]